MPCRTLILSIKQLVEQICPDLPPDTRIMGGFVDGVHFPPPIHSDQEVKIVVVLQSDDFNTHDPIIF